MPEFEFWIVTVTIHYIYLYRPQTKFAKVMFLQVSVILSTGGEACVAARGGCAWLLPGGHAWLPGGTCVVAPGGVCVVAPGGHAWLLGGGMHGFSDEIRSMSGRYASYWNAFLLINILDFERVCSSVLKENSIRYRLSCTILFSSHAWNLYMWCGIFFDRRTGSVYTSINMKLYTKIYIVTKRISEWGPVSNDMTVGLTKHI